MEVYLERGLLFRSEGRFIPYACLLYTSYITGLYQHALAAMHIAFDALLIPGHERDTGEIPEHNVISICGIYEERPGTFTVSGNKEQAVTCSGDRKSTRLNCSHEIPSRMPSSA